MSESDSFIHEVTDEVRRDRLFRLFRKYSWVLVLAVVAIVGGTAYNEWNKSQSQKQARLTGDMMLAALAAQDTAALETLASKDDGAAVIARLQLANLLEAEGDIAGALEVLRRITLDMKISPVYADLAWLKIIMLDGENMSDSERNGAYDRLTAAAAPYRLLALEQQAMQYVRDGDTETAKAVLASILDDPAVTPNLRNRAQQLIVALGGEIGAQTENG